MVLSRVATDLERMNPTYTPNLGEKLTDHPRQGSSELHTTHENKSLLDQGVESPCLLVSPQWDGGWAVPPWRRAFTLKDNSPL